MKITGSTRDRDTTANILFPMNKEGREYHFKLLDFRLISSNVKFSYQANVWGAN